jgi:hypothetical protein
MNKITTLAVLTAGFTLAGSSIAPALAQEPTKVFLDVNGGAQTESRTIESSTSFPLYGETAIINASQSIASGGLFDVSGGYRFLRSLGVGIGVSVFSSKGDGAIAASIPSPIAFNKPVTVTATATDLKHSEVGYHVMLVYFAEYDKTEFAAFIGPSFFQVKQDILSATVPPGTQTINTATNEETASATGLNAGVNISYMFHRNYGAGVFLRYAGATADLPSAPDVKVGGFQFGLGLRLRF